MNILVSDALGSVTHAETCRDKILEECPTASVTIYYGGLGSSIDYAVGNGLFDLISRSTDGLADDDVDDAETAFETGQSGAFDISFTTAFDRKQGYLGIVHAHGGNTYEEINDYSKMDYICACGDVDGSYGDAFEFYTTDETTQSYATARIAGIIAQLLVDHPTWNFFDARAALQMTATLNTSNTQLGFGAINKTLATAVENPLFPPMRITATASTGYIDFSWLNSLQATGSNLRTCIKKFRTEPEASTGKVIYSGTDESFRHYTTGDYYYQFYTIDDDENYSAFGKPIYILADGGDMSWGNAILSTSTSIAKIESEINNLTSTNWNNAIAMAKELIGDKLEIIFTERGYSVDEQNGDVLLNVINNPEVFNISSDYLTLALIFEDLSQGSEGLYMTKAQKYYTKFDQKFPEDVKRINLDTNLDETVDNYRINWQGALSR